jgi:hypothetical protein
MRFSRDKRGYENTFVVHAERKRGKGRSRLLYWFRTPPGVKVGRAALDEDAIRLLEQLNPDVEFDWTRILKGDAAPGEEVRPPSGERRVFDRGRSGSPRRRDEDRRREPRRSPPAAATQARTPAVEDLEPQVSPVPERREDAGPAAAAPEPALEPLDAAADVPPDASGPLAQPTPAHARLGSEGVSRLRGRYAEVLARIAERVPDAARRDELKLQAERLNPDSWVTDEEVKAGLEGYEGVFESLRAVVGKRRRRRRRGSPRIPGTGRADSSAGITEPVERPPDDAGGDDDADTEDG